MLSENNSTNKNILSIDNYEKSIYLPFDKTELRIGGGGIPQQLPTYSVRLSIKLNYSSTFCRRLSKIWNQYQISIVISPNGGHCINARRLALISR